MRPPCRNCTRKHLAQAHILMQEALQGYPEHAWLAVGHLAEAAEEIMGLSREFADRIRQERLRYIASIDTSGPITHPPAHHIDVLALIRDAAEVGKTYIGQATPEQAVAGETVGEWAARMYPPTPASAAAIHAEIDRRARAATPATTIEEAEERLRAIERSGSITDDLITVLTNAQLVATPPTPAYIEATAIDVAAAERQLAFDRAHAPNEDQPTVGQMVYLMRALKANTPEQQKALYQRVMASDKPVLWDVPTPSIPTAPPTSSPQNPAQSLGPPSAEAKAHFDRIMAERAATTEPKPYMLRYHDGPLVEVPRTEHFRELNEFLAAHRTGQSFPPHLSNLWRAYLREQGHDVSVALSGIMPEVAKPADVASASSPLCCADKAALDAVVRALTTDAAAYTSLTVILTTLGDFHPSYSLASVVLEQAHALVLCGHRVVIIVHSGAQPPPMPLPPSISLLPVLPRVPFISDQIDERGAQTCERVLNHVLSALFNATPVAARPNYVITHDVLFQAAYVTLAKAVHTLATYLTPEWRVTWFHMAHSSVGARPTFTVRRSGINESGGRWSEAESVWYRCTLPPGHHLIVLNHPDVPHFLNYYRTGSTIDPLDAIDHALPPELVHTLLNPRDIRPHLRMTQDAAMLTTRFGLHVVDVCCLFPCSQTRLPDKGIQHALAVIGALKASGLSVRLVVALAHANGEDAVPRMAWLREHAAQNGLTVTPDEGPAAVNTGPAPSGVPAVDLVVPSDPVAAVPSTARATGTEDVILTPAVLPLTATYGLDADTMRSLWGVTNLFLCPSISEAGPLTVLEAALSGCLLVLNGSLPALHDYIPLEKALWVAWGSMKGPGAAITSGHYATLADQIWARLSADRGGSLKRYAMRRHALETYGAELSEILAGRDDDTADSEPPIAAAIGPDVDEALTRARAQDACSHADVEIGTGGGVGVTPTRCKTCGITGYRDANGAMTWIGRINPAAPEETVRQGIDVDTEGG
jgi:glycosyltransferase involved in cell wall biosynthesis